MFTAEELSLIKSYLDARQDRKVAIAGLEAALPATDAAIRPEMEDLLARLRQISDVQFSEIDFDNLLLDDTISGE